MIYISTDLANLEIALALGTKNINSIEEALAKCTNNKAFDTVILQARLFILQGNNQQAAYYLLATKSSYILKTVIKPT